MIMAVIALFPMSLELAASYSYDCEVNALSFLFIAYTMYLIFEKKCGRMERTACSCWW